MDAQADLSLCWAHTHFVGFVMSRLISVLKLRSSVRKLNYLRGKIVCSLSFPCSPIFISQKRKKLNKTQSSVSLLSGQHFMYENHFFLLQLTQVSFHKSVYISEYEIKVDISNWII